MWKAASFDNAAIQNDRSRVYPPYRPDAVSYKFEPLTEAEREIVDMLANAYNAFCDLPVEHPMDQDEFCRAIHVLQDKVLARPGRREMNAGRAA